MLKNNPIKYHIGIDEVGRGPLAGPVTVCAFAILEQDLHLLKAVGANDSKQLSEQKRNIVVEKIGALKKAGHCVYAIASVSAPVIDRKGLSKAVKLAVTSVLNKLNIHPEHADVYLDGSLRAPESFFRQKTIIGGDGKVMVISCASCLAKVHRDNLMDTYDLKFPQYGFLNHKGYGTPDHYRAIRKHGISVIHRQSFLKDLRKSK